MNRKLNVHNIEVDRWDRDDLKEILAQASVLRTARRELGKAAPSGKEAVEDAFFVLYKSLPQLRPAQDVVASHRVNRAVMQAMVKLPEFSRLRDYTVNDLFQSAMAVVSLERDLERIFDRFAQETKLAQRLHDLLRQLEQATRVADGHLDRLLDRLLEEVTEEEQAELDEAVVLATQAESDLEAQCQALERELDEALAGRNATLTLMVRDGLQAAIGELAGFASTSRGWGVEPGELQRLPVAERLEMAQRLSSPRMREISRIFGRLQTMTLSDFTSLTVAPREIDGLEYGDDLSRLVPSELLWLADPSTEDEFYRRFAEGELLQFTQQSEESRGQGAIIFCEDGSGSMDGAKETTSKAVMLMLLSVAKEQKRAMHVLHFGSARQIKTFSFVEPADFTFERIVEVAELFWSGGTDFVTPMTEALALLGAEHDATGAVSADVVFITDGYCGVPAEFMTLYLEEMRRLGATTWGIVAEDLRRPEEPIDEKSPLYLMSEGKVLRVSDFDSGRELRPMLRGIIDRHGRPAA